MFTVSCMQCTTHHMKPENQLYSVTEKEVDFQARHLKCTYLLLKLTNLIHNNCTFSKNLIQVTFWQVFASSQTITIQHEVPFTILHIENYTLSKRFLDVFNFLGKCPTTAREQWQNNFDVWLRCRNVISARNTTDGFLPRLHVFVYNATSEAQLQRAKSKGEVIRATNCFKLVSQQCCVASLGVVQQLLRVASFGKICEEYRGNFVLRCTSGQ